MDFLTYEQVTRVVVYTAFWWMICIAVLGYVYIVISGIRQICRFWKKCFGKETAIEEGEANE